MKKFKQIFVFLGFGILFTFLFVYITSLNFRNKESDSKIFAESITVTYPRTINLHIDNNLIFTETPYKITPSNYNQDITLKITDHKNQVVKTASFSENRFKAEKIGSYYLKFFVKDKYGEEIYDTIKIKVVNEASNIASITKNSNMISISENENVDLSNYLSFYNLSSSKMEYRCNNTLLSNTIYQFNNAGDYTINVNAVCDNLIINVSFVVSVKEANLTAIEVYLNSETDKISENEVKTISLLDKNFSLFINILGANSQEYNYEIINIDILEVVSSDIPLLILKPNKKGVSKIIISSIDNSIEFSFYIKILS